MEPFNFKPQKPEDYSKVGVPVFKTMFGSLSDDPASPLSRISVANSSFSLDPTVGCPTKCAYCVRGSNMQDLLVEDQPSGMAPSLNHKFFYTKPTKLFF